MSWEMVTLVSVIVLCGTMNGLFGKFMRLKVQEEASKQVAELGRLMNGLSERMRSLEEARAEVLEIPVIQTRVKVLEENQITMLKVVDEAKKLISTMNLATGLGAQPIGGFTSRMKA